MLNIDRPMSRSKFTRKAFSLPEFAIVIGVVGVIFALLWNYASNAWDMARCTLMTESVAIVVTNLRTMYGSQLTLPLTVTPAAAAVPTTTANFIPVLFVNNVIPYSMQRPINLVCSNTANSAAVKLCADTPWGPTNTSAVYPGNMDPNGTFQVCSWSYGSAQTDCVSPAPPAPVKTQYFGVELKGLSQQDCVQLGSQISSSTTITGLLQVYVNGVQPVVAAIPQLPVAPTTLTKLPSAAAPYCKTGASTNNIVFVYSL